VEGLGYYELKHKLWFNERYSRLLAKLQCLEDPSKMNEDNLSNIICEASRHFINNNWKSESQC
jgi:hypothetical protein